MVSKYFSVASTCALPLRIRLFSVIDFEYMSIVEGESPGALSNNKIYAKTNNTRYK